ncbi:MAG: hypothetical protein II341_04335 [Oscillospiraceae bacterium]|nr:hypothetical protein [Oscillospiraceae bacterium]
MLNYHKTLYDVTAWLLMLYAQQTRRGIIPNDFPLAVDMTCYDCIWFEPDSTRRTLSAIAILLFLDRETYRLTKETFQRLVSYLHFEEDYPDTLDMSEEDRAQMKRDMLSVNAVIQYYETHPEKLV